MVLLPDLNVGNPFDLIMQVLSRAQNGGPSPATNGLDPNASMQGPGLPPGYAPNVNAQVGNGAGGGGTRNVDSMPNQPQFPNPVANSQGNATRDQGAPVGANGQPNPGGVVGNPQGAAMVRYPSSNPGFALQSALQDMGVNPFRANPMMAQTMKLAPGLAQSFLINNVGTSAETTAGRGGEGQMFGDYLRAALSGQGGASLMDPINSGRGNLQGALAQIGAMQDALMASGKGGGTAGVGLGDTNPFAQALSSIYDDPQGAAGAYGALTTPFLSQGVGQAYQQGLGNVAGQALRRTANDYGNSVNVPNFWNYLFPNL